MTREWMKGLPGDVFEYGEEHSDEYGVTIRWKHNTKFPGIEFRSSVAMMQPDGSLLYERCDESGPVLPEDEFWKSDGLVDGFVKWDGCSHLNFGDEGYLHVCGGRDFAQLVYVLKRVTEIASQWGDLDHCADMPVEKWP